MTVLTRHRHGLVWHVDQAAVGYSQRIIHTLDHHSVAVRVPSAVVVFAACGAAALPLPEGVPPPSGWRYCVSPSCWQKPAVES